MKLVEGIVTDIVKANNDFDGEWRMVKGRATFTAWDWKWACGQILVAPTLCGLMDQVEQKCRKSQ
jgi:hypothetical protein